ncbi:MAG: Glutamine synthetase [Chloroflexi bacterium]|nr:Glutamine synthetase [Chloroflexota bacterium]
MDSKKVVSSVEKRVKEDEVKFISLQFTDVNGTVKSVDITPQRLTSALEDGVWFDGSSVGGFARVQESDMRLVLDPDTYAVLPWSNPELKRARIFCDIYRPDGEPFSGDPRGILKRVLKQIEEKGWTFNIGPEPEFFLFKRNGEKGIHPVPYDVGGYFDFSSRDEATRVRNELMHALDAMGLDVEMGHHEVARGQHEIDFRYTNALRAADNVITMKYTVKAIAAKYDLIASFMPKPIYGVNGSGMHCHQSIFDENGKNLFYSADDENHLSELAYGFIAGQLKHARSMSAVIAPTANSYKRLVPGYEAPVYVGWAQINRSALIRLPRYTQGRNKSIRLELRCPDPSANPYLAFVAMLAAGLDGIENDIPCPAPLNNLNIYDLNESERQEKGIDALPGSLAEAMYEFEKNEVIQDALGTTICDVFHRAKWAEVEEYRTRVTDWEVQRYLEVA